MNIQKTKSGQPPTTFYELHKEIIIKDELTALAKFMARTLVIPESLKPLKDNIWIQVNISDFNKFLEYYSEEYDKQNAMLRKPFFSEDNITPS
jgi:hypothetical protein